MAEALPSTSLDSAPAHTTSLFYAEILNFFYNIMLYMMYFVTNSLFLSLLMLISFWHYIARAILSGSHEEDQTFAIE